MAGVIYLGHIPLGFFEREMNHFFSQFGNVTRLKLSRSKKTGQSRGYAFIEFQYAEVAKIAAETMDNYMMADRVLICKYLQPEDVHPDTFKFANQPGTYNPIRKKLKKVKIYNADRTDEQEARRVYRIKKKLKQKMKHLQELGITVDPKQFIRGVDPDKIEASLAEVDSDDDTPMTSSSPPKSVSAKRTVTPPLVFQPSKSLKNEKKVGVKKETPESLIQSELPHLVSEKHPTSLGAKRAADAPTQASPKRKASPAGAGAMDSPLPKKKKSKTNTPVAVSAKSPKVEKVLSPPVKTPIHTPALPKHVAQLKSEASSAVKTPASSKARKPERGSIGEAKTPKIVVPDCREEAKTPNIVVTDATPEKAGKTPASEKIPTPAGHVTTTPASVKPSPVRTDRIVTPLVPTPVGSATHGSGKKRSKLAGGGTPGVKTPKTTNSGAELVKTPVSGSSTPPVGILKTPGSGGAGGSRPLGATPKSVRISNSVDVKVVASATPGGGKRRKSQFGTPRTSPVNTRSRSAKKMR